MRKPRIALAPAVALAVPLVGCDREGPAERAGERMDDATKGVDDATD